MITPFSILQTVIAGFGFASCLIVIIYIWARKTASLIWPLAVLSLFLSIFSLSKMLLNSTRIAEEAVIFSKVLFLATSVTFPMLLIFYKKITRMKPGYLDFFVYAIYAVYGIGTFALPLGFDYSALRPMEPMNLGMLGTVYSTINWQITPVFIIMQLAHGFVITYCFYIVLKSWDNEKSESFILVIPTLAILILVIYQLLIILRIIRGPGIAEFIGFVINLSIAYVIFSRERMLYIEIEEREKKLTTANIKIEAMNRRLTETNNELQEEISNRQKTEQSLRESEERYREITVNVPGFLFQYEIKDNGQRSIYYLDKRSYEMFGIEIEPLETWYQRFVSCFYDEDRQRLKSSLEEIEINSARWNFEGAYLKPSGERIYIKIISQLADAGNRRFWNGLVLDITDQKHSEELLKKSEKIFTTIFHKSPMSMAILNFDDNSFIEVNQAWLDLTGYTKEEVLGKQAMELRLWSRKDQLMSFVNELLANKHVTNMEFLSQKKNGETLYLLMNSEILILDGNLSVLSICEDITKRKRDEESIKKSLSEKETLLKELYHRTKNNMQIICSLLQLQSGSLENPEMIRILSETGQRIKTMALVHQKLYQSNDLSLINLREYTEDLVSLLTKFFSVKAGYINVSIIAEDIFILIDYGITIGLIINEIVSNVFKYAFPGDSRGKLLINIFRNETGNITMIFKDNGVGLPDNYNIHNANTLGMQLITSLSVDQLGGKLDIDRNGGLKYTISFSDDLYEKRV
jgi:PAS domain S-box-containing protein